LCSAAGIGTASVASAQVVNITWETMWSGATLTLLNQMVTKFNDTHPGIHVTETSIPGSETTTTAKLLSQIASGSPPDVFTQWWPLLGQFAATGDILPLTPYLTGTYAGFEKFEYPIAVQGGTYKGTLYAAPMSMNSWALYYNKTMLATAGIKQPPKTLAQLDADSAKEWVMKDGKVVQVGLYPDLNENGFGFYTSFFGATNCFNAAGQYNLENCAAAQSEMNWLASFDKYPFAQVEAMQAAQGQVAGGQTDIFVGGRAGFVLSGPWEGAQDIPVSNPTMEGNFGVIPFPGTVGGPSTIGQGNFNIIPKGAAHPAQAFEFIAWLAGYNNEAFTASIDPIGGWVPAGPSVTKYPAYQKWLKANPWLSTFLPQMSSKYSAAPDLTPTESQEQIAVATATDNVLQKIMTPAQALKYIDQQGNASS
jgi:multiple sugar transport system substrate-binding protein